MDTQQSTAPVNLTNSKPPEPLVLPSKKSKLPLVLCMLLIIILVGVVSYILGTKSSNNKVATPTPTSTLISPTAQVDETSSWQTYTDDKYHFSFKHPARYQQTHPVPGGSAPVDGQYEFAGSTGKSDHFFLDITNYSGSLDAFIKEHTAYSEVTKNNEVTVNNTLTPLGQLVTKDKMIWYKYVNHYDQKINPGAVDILNYTGFFQLGDEVFVIRSSNTIDSIAELKLIASTFKLSPQADTTNWKTYTDSSYRYSFQYPQHDERGNIVVLTFGNSASSPLSGEKNLSIGYMNSDMNLMNIFIFKSNLSETEWWNTLGVKKYTELVKGAHDAMSPTLKEFSPPVFSTSSSTIDNKKALVARGNLELNQGGGDTIVSVVSNNGYIFVFDQQVGGLPEQQALKKSNAIVSTFKFE